MTDDIVFMPATRLLALYRSRQLSPVEVIERALRRLETYESALNAFVLYDPEMAVAMARASPGQRRGVLRQDAYEGGSNGEQGAEAEDPGGQKA
jgi:Asp-tRNA(Asn)/Glu-tRNA(Gln) amidotransferase A subunit family amidase